MSSQSSHTRTKCVAVSLAVIASVAATSSTAWGQATPDLFAKVETLTLSDGTPVSGIAAISGNTAVVGHDGVVTVFHRPSGGDHWVERATLVASDGTPEFGRSVAVDGRTIVVGADSAAFVFARIPGSGWQEIKKLSGDTNPFSFGHSVAVSGTTVVVGAPVSSESTRANHLGEPGLAYVFEQDQGGASAWGEIARLKAPSLIPPGFLGLPNFFGWSVSIDRDQVVAGAEQGTDFPRAYVFSRDQDGPNAWGWVATLDVVGGFGIPDAQPTTVSISRNTVMAGSGQLFSARIFERDEGGANAWGFVDVRAPFGVPELRSGSVSVSGDLAVVSSDSAGGTYVFARNQGASGSWGGVARLPRSIPIPGFADVAISNDTTLVVNRSGSEQRGPIEVYVADTDRDGLRDGVESCPRDPLNNVVGRCQRASAVHPVLDELIAQGDVTSESQGRRQIITATFTNTSETAVQNPFFEVTELTGGNVLLNGDAGRGRVGATLSPDVGDGVLSPGESMTVTFRIRLRTHDPFQFFVTFHGDPVP